MTDKTNVVEIPDEPKPYPAVSQSRMVALETVNFPYRVTFPAGIPAEAAEQVSFWSHNASRLRPLYRFEAVAEDGAWMADLLVLSVGNNWAKVQVLNKWELGDSTPLEVPSAYEVKWAGPVAKFRVLYEGKPISPEGGFPDRPAANRWLADHLRTLAK